MALLDFLQQGIGGTQQAQGPNMIGDAGVGPVLPKGPTWGSLLQAGMQYGSKPGSSAPILAGLVPTEQAQPKTMMPTPQEKNPQDSSLSKIVSALMSLIGL